MGAPISWFEINTGDSVNVAKFYTDLFGWKLADSSQPGYQMISTGDGQIGGGIGDARGENQVTFYIEVADPQAYLDKIEKAGGRTVVPVTQIPGMVTFAQFADPQGNVVGLVSPTEA